MTPTDTTRDKDIGKGDYSRLLSEVKERIRSA